MSETIQKKTGWVNIAQLAADIEADLTPAQVRLDEVTRSAWSGSAPFGVCEALERAQKAVDEARLALRRLARELEAGEFRKPCARVGCGDDQENRTGLCYKHRQEAAEEVRWTNP